jgi:hypothetical protein
MSKLPERHDKELLSPVTKAVLQLIQGLLPALTAIAAGVWVAWTYFDHQKQVRFEQEAQAARENTTHQLEAQKPFNQKQLELYVEAAQVTGRLVSAETFGTDEWKNDARRFEELYWTELTMVEDDGVKNAMVEFRPVLRAIIQKGSLSEEDRRTLQDSSYHLAKALNASIASTWVVTLSEVTQLNSTVCIGEPLSGCPPGTVPIGCNTTAETWAQQQQCLKSSVTRRPPTWGGRCGYQLVDIQCTRRK